MAGNRNSGRKTVEDVKTPVSYRLPLSTIIELEEVSEKLGKTKSEILQIAVGNFTKSLKELIGK